MDYQKNIEALRLEGGIEITGKPRRVAEFFDGLDVAISAMQELQEYKQIGTLEEVREAVEKQQKAKQQKAKHPIYDGDGYAPDGTFVWDEWLCPKCGTRYEVDYDDYDYCPNCGQRIDWSEEE